MSADSLEALSAQAEAGNPDAATQLAVRLLNGEGVPRDAARARELLRVASEQGFTEAQVRLGLLLLKGEGGAVDDDEAKKWFSQAADAGNALAMANLGLLLIMGSHELDTRERGFHLVYQAAAMGDQFGNDALQMTPRLLSPAELQVARESIQTPRFMLVLGPPTEGHLDGIFDAYQDAKNQDRGSVDPAVLKWEEIERDVAGILFSQSADEEQGLSSWFADLFQSDVRVTNYFVGFSLISGMWLATIQFSYGWIVDRSGLPVTQQPRKEVADYMATQLAVMLGRKWVRWLVTFFPSVQQAGRAVD